ncbi:MAG: hypothetical protein ACTSWW_09050, partial [Promethearchaeota archaeon]
ITKEEYESRKAVLKPINVWTTQEKSAGTVYCDGDSCHVVEEAAVLQDLEAILGVCIPQISEITATTFGFHVENGLVVGLGLYNQKMKHLPDSIGTLEHLRTLNLCGCGLTALPDTVAQLQNVLSLDLRNNKFTDFSDEVEHFFHELQTRGRTVMI